MTIRWHTREDSGIRLDREGNWFHDDALVEHPKIVDAFNRGISKSADGRYVLSFGNDWCFVTVEDAPLQVVGARLAGEPPREVFVSFSNGRDEPLRLDTLRHDGDVLYCASADGLEARFGRAAQGALASVLDERDGEYVLAVGGRSVPVPPRRR